MQPFRDFVQKFVALNDAEFQAFADDFVPTKYAKGGYFTEMGKACRQMGFLAEGALRTFYIDDKGREVTRRLALSPCMISAYESFVTGRPCREYNQFLEDSTVLVIDRVTDLRLMEAHRKYADFRRQGIEMEFVGVLNYLEQMLDRTAEERYLGMLRHRPQVLQRFPLQYVASMLGITPTQLSRIRKKTAGG